MKIIILITNIVILILLFLVFDYYTAKHSFEVSHQNLSNIMKFHKDYEKLSSYVDISKFKYDLRLIYFKEYWENQKKNFNSPRRIVKINKNTANENKKGAIIVFGCSFAEGAFLNDNETIEYKLSQLTNRTVYNRGFSGFGLGQMVWQTKQSEFYDDIKEPVDYVIYIYILDHLRRIYEHKYGHSNVYLSYEAKNGNLIEKNPITLQLNRFYIISNLFKNFIFPNFQLNKKNDDKNFDLIKLHFEEARKELQKRYPNVKFIIIKHPFSLDIAKDYKFYSLYVPYVTERWKELEDEGFIIYDLSKKLDTDITTNDYIFPDGHPNTKAWDIVSEKLVKDLNL